MAKPRAGRFLYGFKHILEAFLGGGAKVSVINLFRTYFKGKAQRKVEDLK